MGIFASFGVEQAEAGSQRVEGRVHLQVVEGEPELLFKTGQRAFTAAAAPPLAGPLHRKTRIGLLLATRHERLDQGTRRF